MTPLPPAPPKPPGPVLEYALPAAKKSWLPSPALIKNLGCLFKMCFALAVALVGGYCALVALNPKAQKWATQGAKDGSGGPTPFNAVNQILAIPAQAIGKTKDVVAAGDARAGVLDGVIADSEGKNKKPAGGGGAALFAEPVVDPFASTPAGDKPKISAARAAAAAGVDAKPADQGVSRAALLAMSDKLPGVPAGPPVPAAPAEPAAPPEVKLAGGIVIATASPAGGPVVRASFLYWVVGQNISGVFQSSPHRIMLNGHLAYEGQEVNAALGITFDHLELTKKLIVFRDKAGALVTRSY